MFWSWRLLRLFMCNFCYTFWWIKFISKIMLDCLVEKLSVQKQCFVTNRAVFLHQLILLNQFFLHELDDVQFFQFKWHFDTFSQLCKIQINSIFFNTQSKPCKNHDIWVYLYSMPNFDFILSISNKIARFQCVLML